MPDKENPLPIQVDIVSDVVCPWCIIGYRQLEQALALTNLKANIKWHPFELNPAMSAGGQDMREHLAEKYGTTPQQSDSARQRLTALGDELGFRFDFADGARIVNTFQAHQLIEWAEQQGRQNDVKQALFAAYFTQGRDVSNVDVLVDVAGTIGLDPSAACLVLERGEMAENIRAKQAFWTKSGVSGVPAMVFDKQHLITGAQEALTYAKILQRLAGEHG